MKLGNGLTVSLGEARMVDYVRTKFALAPGKAHTLKTSMYDCADIITPYDTPWRVIMAAERPVDLIAHNFIYLNLNEPNVLHSVADSRRKKHWPPWTSPPNADCNTSIWMPGGTGRK